MGNKQNTASQATVLKEKEKRESVKNVKEKPQIILDKNHFDFLYVVGRGGFGKVWKVCYKKNKKVYYALKEMSKAKIIDKKSERSIKYEKELLAKINHPFIVNMNYAFQDNDNLYLVMDLLTGGDLRYHICKHKKFTEEQTKFFVACIILGLEYIHMNNILHRDIKPENLVLDERGYVRITDFGIAKIYQKENSSETSGTPGYMAPEVMCAQNHTIAVDYFALGVLCFEFMFGFRPYLGKTRKEIKEKIMAKQVQIRKNEIPEGWSIEAADIINRLLQRKPANRLGLRGAQEIKDHAWLKYYPWKDLYEKKLESPFIPKIGDNFDAKYCNSSEKMGNATRERYEVIVRQDNYKETFNDFFYYFNELDPNDKHNTRDRKKFYNPHLKINDNLSQIRSTSANSASAVNLGSSMTSMGSNNNNNINSSSSYNIGGYANNANNGNNNNYCNFNNNNVSGSSNFNYGNIQNSNSVNNFGFGNGNSNIQRSINEKINILNNIENKFSKIKILSSSSAASRSVIKHYRNASTSNLSVNSASTSNTSNMNNNNMAGYGNIIHKRSGSTANFQY